MSGTDDRRARAADPAEAARLRARFHTPPAPDYRRPWALLALLGIVVALFVVSLPLVWHHDMVAGQPDQTVYGYTHNYWLLFVCAVLIGIGARIALRQLTIVVIVILIFAVLLTLTALYDDWANSYSQAANLHRPQFIGPGVYVAIAGLVGIVLATALAWWGRATARTL